MHLLGGSFDFRSNSRRLLRLVDIAYAGLPAHSLSEDDPHFHLELRLTDAGNLAATDEPPRVQTQGGGGLLCGVMDAGNFAVVSPQLHKGLVAVSRDLLRWPYHARYELLEFAVFTLASRAQDLAPLHAACVGLGGVGILLIGESGAGKSTLALQCMLQGLDLLAEDAVFVAPANLLATGIANFLHLRGDALPFIEQRSIAAQVRKSPVIRRRSGVEKFEVDLRRKWCRVAPAAMRIAGVVFVSKAPGTGGNPLPPLGKRQLLARLEASQPYAAQLPGWAILAGKLAQLDAYELRRAGHPSVAAAALRTLLETGFNSR